MLPNRLNLLKTTEDQLKKLKQRTGVTPNVSARIAFCQSVETGKTVKVDATKVDGTLNLDKTTWLGDYAELYELLLQDKYPKLSNKELELAWALHVAHGCSLMREGF